MSKKKRRNRNRNRNKGQAQASRPTTAESTVARGELADDGSDGTKATSNSAQAPAGQSPKATPKPDKAENRAGDDGSDDTDPGAKKPGLLSRLFEAYSLLAYTLGGGLCVAMIVARYGGSAMWQWLIGGTAILAVILAKTVFSDDISDIYAEAREQVEEERRRDQEELDSGNFDGVPQIMQDLLKYPTKEDYRRIQAEAEQQRELLRNMRGRKNGKSEDGGDE